MEKKMRAMFTCLAVTNYRDGKEAVLTAVTGGTEEKRDFNKYTPAGEIKIMYDTEEASDFFIPGKDYYIDFSIAE